ncbi:MAG: hypothetical protein AAF654_02470 [Myxococcota bacterium]
MALVGFAHTAHAIVEGVTPTQVADFELFGSHSATGAPVMVPDFFREEISSILLDQSSAVLDDMPFDHQVVAAYLFWSGSTPRSNRTGPPDSPDFDVDFTTADGTFYNDLSIFDEMNGFNQCFETAAFGGFYYCRRDVTSIIAAQGIGNANGTYVVGDLDADAGTLNGGDGQASVAQAKYGGWSLLVVWESETEEIRRNVVFYDGFARLDENAVSTGQVSFNIGDFVVGSPALGRLSLFGLEGDDQLGVPPQDQSPLSPCATCFDFISFQAGSAATATKLSNGENPPNNSFNSSFRGASPGVDIDTYNLSGLIQTNDTSAEITVSSGDGVLGGGGESFFLGWLIMSVDTLTPRFNSSATKKTVSPTAASAGQSLFYTLDVVNDGSETATSVVLTDPLPAGTSYVPGTTRVDGSPVADVSGQSALQAGLSLGSIPYAAVGDNSRQVTFQVRIDPTACGDTVTNVASIDANEIDAVTIGPVTTSVDDVSIDTPTLSVSTVGGATAGPGTFLNYVVEFPNSSGEDIGGVSFELPVPQFTTVTNAFPSSGTATVTGTEVTVDDFVIGADGSARITVFARVFDEGQFAAASVPAEDIDGLVITAQGLATGGCGAPELSDGDLALSGAQPTELPLFFRPIFGTSTKGVADLNGAPLEPGDVLTYEIVVRNTGNRPGTGTVTDPIPISTTYVAGSTTVDGAPRSDTGGFPFVSGASIGSVPPGGERTVAFQVQVDGLVPDGTAITNVADLAIAEEPDEDRTLTSPTLTVTAAPDLLTSTLVVSDENASPFEPGDRVRYTLTLNNTGNRPATGLRVVNPLPANLAFVSATSGGSLSAGSVIWDLADLPRDDTVVLEYVADIATPLGNGTVITNRATVSTTELDDLVLEANLTVVSSPILVVTKVVELSETPAMPGTGVTYRVRIQNDGNAPAENVEVVDTINSALVNISAPGGRVLAQTVTFDASSDPRLASIAPGVANSVELVISAEVRSPIADGTIVSNVATVAADGVAPVDSDDPTVPGLNPTTFTVTSDLTVAFVKRVVDLTPGTPFGPGDRVRYELEVNVSGTSILEDTVIVDEIPSALSAIDAPGGSVAAQTVTFSLGDLPAGSSEVFTVDATINSLANGTLVSNDATLNSSSLTDPLVSNVADFTVVSEARGDAELTVSRVGGGAVYRPGDTVRYSARIENVGNAASSPLEFTIPIPASLRVTDAGGGMVGSGTVSWGSAQVPAFTSLAAGSQVIIDFEAELATPLDNGTEVALQGTITGFSTPTVTDDPSTAAEDDPTRFSVESAPVLEAFIKAVEDVTGDPLVTRAGDVLRYRLTVRNEGDAVARDVVVTDPIDGALTPAVPANATLSAGALRWTLATEPALAAVVPGTDLELVFEATVDAAAAAGLRIPNQATVSTGALSAQSDNPATAALDDSTDVFVSGDTDLGATTKRVTDLAGTDIDSASPGDEVRFTIVVENRGTDPATAVAVEDVFDPGFVIVAAPGAVIGGQTVNWTLSDPVGAGERVELPVTVRLADGLNSGAVLLNQASVDAAELADPILSDFDLATLAREPTSLEVEGRAELATRNKRFVNPVSGAVLTSARPGEQVRVEVTLGNEGGADATDIEVIDDLDTEKLSNIIVRDGGTLVGAQARWTGVSVPAGGTTVFRVDARLRAQLDNEPLSNQAFVGVGGADPTLPTDDPAAPGPADPTVLEIISPPDITSSRKEALLSNGTISPGQEFDYRITVSNTGTGSARGVTVTDPLDPRLEFVAVSDGGTFEAGTRTVAVDLPDIGAGDERSVTLTVRVDSTISARTVIDNQATISADNAPDELTDDPIAGSDAPTQVTVIVGPRLTLSKTVRSLDAGPYVSPGDRLEYRFVVTNAGNGAATNVRIEDELNLASLGDFELPDGGIIAAGQLTFFSPLVLGLGRLEPGGSVEMRLRATVTESATSGEVLTNQATASANELDDPVLSDDPSTPDLGDSTDIELRFPNLLFTKAVAPAGPVTPGETLTYTIRLRNDGLVAADAVTVADPLPVELEGIVLDPPSGTFSAGIAEWSPAGLADLASVGPGVDLTFTVTGTVADSTPNGTFLSNQALLRVVGLDEQVSDWPDTPVFGDPTVVEVQVIPDIVAAKTAIDDDGLVSPGEVFSYTIEVLNQGRSAARDVEIRDLVPEQLEILDATGASVDGQTLTWSVGELAPDARELVEFTARVRPGTVNGFLISNQGEVDTRELVEAVLTDDPRVEGETNPTVVTVVAEPSLNGTVLVATDLNGGAVQPGDRIRYELRVVNDGTSQAVETFASLPLPPFTQYVAGSTTLNGQPVADIDVGPLVGLSPIFERLMTTSPRSGTPDGTVLPNDGLDPEDENAVARFDLRIDPRALPGTVIETQARIDSAALSPVLSDDCSRTQGIDCEGDVAIGEATVLVVGGGATFAVEKAWTLATDRDGNGRPDPGDQIRYTIRALNVGTAAAEAVRVEDPIPAGAAYVGGSLTVNGESVTDAAGDDSGGFLDGLVFAELASVSPGELAIVTLDVTVGDVAVVENQATVLSEGRRYLSDGDPSIAGEQPTRTVVDRDQLVATATLEAVDRTGGVVDPGDTLLYRLTVVNDGGVDIEGGLIRLDRDAVFATDADRVVTPANATLLEDGLSWRASIAAGSQAIFEVESTLNADLAIGQAFAATGRAPELGFASDPVQLVVGGGAGSALVQGLVFLDRGERNGDFDAGRDEPLSGFTVALIPEGAESESQTSTRNNPDLGVLAIRSVITGGDGRYQTGGVPAGRYRVVVASNAGTVFAELANAIDVDEGLVEVPPVAIDPSGVIYEVQDGVAVPVEGARVFLVDEATGDDIDASFVAAGQQGQVTTASGFYRFDLRAEALPGEFRLRVEPPLATLFFPSGQRPPVGADSENPLGSVAPPGVVSSFDFPNPSEDSSYFLRFALDVDSEDVTNNHVPLDRLADVIRLTKQVNRRRATVGEILTYTITVTNPLATDITTEDIGPRLVDILPVGIQWPTDGEAVRTVNGENQILPVQRRSARSVEFAPFSLPAQSTTTIRYYAVVGLRATGELTNRAQLRSASNQLISNEGTAKVRIVDDPIFDEGTVLGRVFCDDDGDGRLTAGESGLPGARVYLDTGFYVDADPAGKFHFRGVRPGRHVIKVDANTLPPGSEITTDRVRDFIVTRGLLAKIDFGVRCAWEQVAVRPIAQGTGTEVTVLVDPSLPGVSFDGAAQDVLLVDGMLVPEHEEAADFAGAGALYTEGLGPLEWRVRVPARSDLRRWSLSVFGADDREVWRISGSGTPPSSLAAVFDANTFDAGQSYLYRLAVETTRGEIAEGRWREFTVAEATAAGSSGEEIAVLRENLFEPGDELRLTASLGERLKSLVEELGSPVPPVRLEVHSAGGERSANDSMTRSRALLVMATLIELGVPNEGSVAVGLGDSQPLMPNATELGRKQNERIVIRRVKMPSAPEPIEYPQWVRLDGKNTSESGGLVSAPVWLEDGDSLTVDVREVNGRRTQLKRVYPFETVDSAAKRSAALPISGDITSGTVTVSEVNADLRIFASQCLQKTESITVADALLTPAAAFEIETEAAVSAWSLRIFNPDGSVLTELEGDALPEERIEWSGTNRAGNPVARAGTYRYRCILTDDAGGRFVGPMGTLVVSDSSSEGGGAVLANQTFSGDDYPGGELSGKFEEALVAAAEALKQSPAGRLEIEVHESSEAGRVQAQMKTARLSAKIKAKLMRLGANEEQISVRSMGANSPLMPGTSRFAHRQNRRVTLSVSAPSAPAADDAPSAAAVEPRVRIAGQELALNEAGEFRGEVLTDGDGELLVELVGADGRRLVKTLTLRSGVPAAAASGSIQSGPPKNDSPLLGSSPDSLRAPVAPPAPSDSGLQVMALNTQFAAAQEDATAAETATPAPAAEAPSESPGPAPETTTPKPPPEAADTGSPTADAPATDTPAQSDPEAPTAEPASDVPATPSPALAESSPSGAPAGPLVVWMPPDGAQLKGERLTVKGRAAPGLTLTVNGKAVAISAEGDFAHTLVLEPGSAAVEVRGEYDGQILALTRTYEVPDWEWFLLAMADTAVGSGDPIVGMNSNTLREFDNELYLHGRAVAYLKGRVKGERLITNNPFDDIRLTAHVDTGKEDEPELLRQLIDPDRYYPVYGDSTEEVQDVRSRERLYVLLEADQSKLQVGNFRAQLTGQQLFQYQRSFFGANLDLDHTFVEGSRTQVKAFVADGGAGTRHRQLVFQGTGGAMYFLRDGALIEGSERVQLVVRDAVSGARLMVIPQTRDVDYTMQYRDGRLMFMQPIPSTVTANWRLNQNPVRTLEGHRVFVEIEYDYESFLAEDSEDAYAAQLRQTFADTVTVGGGVVQEEREGSQYRLFGADARAKVLPHTEVTAEFAYSEAVDIDTLASFDGGVTFGRIGSPEEVLSDEQGGVVDGWAGSIAIRGDAQDLAAVFDDSFAPAEGPLRFPYELTLQHQAAGFFSGTNVLEQGQTKFGAQVRALVTDVDTVRFRHDGIWSTLFLGENFDEQDVVRQITAVGYERKGDGWSAGAEVGHTYSVLNGASTGQRATTNLFGRIKITPRLTLLGEQEFTTEFSTDSDSPASEQRIQGTADQFATTFGGEYVLTDELSINVTNALRWSGTNSAQVGLRAKLMEDVDVYASERFVTGTAGTVSTLVVGAESHAIPGSRSYGEYQLDHLASGQSGRAVFGMENGWTVTDGLKLLLSYERAQLVSDTTPSMLNTGFAVSQPGITGAGSGALARDQQFSASSYAGGGVFPTGVASRDAFSVGAEYLPSPTFKLATRFELRFDRGDESLGTPDRLSTFGHFGGDYRFHRDFVLLGRVRGASVRRTDVDFDEGQFLDISLGMALRPEHTNAYGGLAKWTRRYERRAAAALDLTQFQLEVSDVLALEPFVELPFGFQLVGKGAVKVYQVQDAVIPTLSTLTFLALGRLNYHLTDAFDVGAEYRWTAISQTEESEHGALFEIAWLPYDYVAVGVGYNFTRFSDDLLADPNLDNHGLFLRVTGRY